MLVTSHFVPLAAPGMVALALKWMWNPASPFYVKPRLSPELLAWGYRFWRAATAEHVRRAAPLLRDLSEASHRCYEELAALPGSDFGLVKKGLLMLCRSRHALGRGNAERRKWAARWVSSRKCLMPTRWQRSNPAFGWRSPAVCTFHRTVTSRPIAS